MDIERLKTLIAQREAIDAEIVEVVGGAKKESKTARLCSICQSADHSARKCPQKTE